VTTKGTRQGSQLQDFHPLIRDTPSCRACNSGLPNRHALSRHTAFAVIQSAGSKASSHLVSKAVKHEHQTSTPSTLIHTSPSSASTSHAPPLCNIRRKAQRDASSRHTIRARPGNCSGRNARSSGNAQQQQREKERRGKRYLRTCVRSSHARWPPSAARQPTCTTAQRASKKCPTTAFPKPLGSSRETRSLGVRSGSEVRSVS
jgi:hypothetical protein